MLSVQIRHQLPGFALDVDFSAPPGVTAIFGKSGSGKTTIVNAVAGLMRPDDGRIAVDGTVFSDSREDRFLPPHRRRVGYVFQDARLFPHLNVRQNLLYGRWFGRARTGAEYSRIIEILGIGDLLDRRPAGLSGGERQRIAVGRAILSNPRLLLMDEPLAALDEARKAEILPFLERLRDEIGLPILYVSHSLAEVARLATSIILIEEGRVRAQGPAAAILSDAETAPLMGLREAGSILSARLASQEADGLSMLVTTAGPVWVPQLQASPDAHLRLRIMAQDVMIALERPMGISALNVLPARITSLSDVEDGVLVRLDAGGEPLLARITARSARTLGLDPGKQVYAVLKAVSVTPGTIGSGRD